MPLNFQINYCYKKSGRVYFTPSGEMVKCFWKSIKMANEFKIQFVIIEVHF